MIYFINADDFLNTLTNYRMLSITGRVGGGKTSLAVILAGWLLHNAYSEHIVSDISIKGDTYPPPFPFKHSAIVLDETWRLIKTTGDVVSYAAYLRKLDNYLLMPSAQDAHSKVTFFECWRPINLYIFGIKGWLYRWKVNKKSVNESGMFIVMNPHEIFGMYDTEEIQKEDGGIAIALQQTVDAEAAKYIRNPEKKVITPNFDRVAHRADIPTDLAEDRAVQSMAVNQQLGKDLLTVAGEMSDAASASRESAEQIVRAVKKIRR